MLKRKGYTILQPSCKKQNTSTYLGHGVYGHVNRIEVDSVDYGPLSCAQKVTNADFYVEEETATGSESFLRFGTHASILSELLVLSSTTTSDDEMGNQQHKIITLYDVICHPDSNIKNIGILMELADCTLRQYMDKHRLPIHQLMTPKCTGEIRLEHVKRSIHIARGLFQSLNQLHQHGFILMDLTPSNIMLKNTSHTFGIRLIDFGLTELQCGWKSFAREKVTWTYRAPELTVHSSHYNEASDIWSVGVILCELFFYHALIDYRDIKEGDMDQHLEHILGPKGEEWKNRHEQEQKQQEYNMNMLYCPDMIGSTSSLEEQQRMERFLIVLIPNRSTRELIFQLYGYRLALRVTELIMECLSYEPRHRPTAHNLSKWNGFDEFHTVGVNDDVTDHQPQTRTTKKLSFPIHQQIREWLHEFFFSPEKQNCSVHSPFLLCLQHITVRLHSEKKNNKQNVVPLPQSLIYECIAVSICLKWFHLHDEYEEKAENLRANVIKLCGLETILFNEQEQLMLHQHLNWTIQ